MKQIHKFKNAVLGYKGLVSNKEEGGGYKSGVWRSSDVLLIQKRGEGGGAL